MNGIVRLDDCYSHPVVISELPIDEGDGQVGSLLGTLVVFVNVDGTIHFQSDRVVSEVAAAAVRGRQ